MSFNDLETKSARIRWKKETDKRLSAQLARRPSVRLEVETGKRYSGVLLPRLTTRNSMLVMIDYKTRSDMVIIGLRQGHLGNAPID